MKHRPDPESSAAEGMERVPMWGDPISKGLSSREELEVLILAQKRASLRYQETGKFVPNDSAYALTLAECHPLLMKICSVYVHG